MGLGATPTKRKELNGPWGKDAGLKTSQGTLFAEAAAPPGPSTVQLIQGDCLEAMPTLEAGSVNMVFADLPYGVTCNVWDQSLSLSSLWHDWWRLSGKHGVYIFTATQPFCSDLIYSNRKQFRHDLIWDKTRASSFANARKSPMRAHEHVLVFSSGKLTYNPQMTEGHPVVVRTGGSISRNWGIMPIYKNSSDKRYPLSVLRIKRDDMRNKNGHPTQKPEALLEWLIATYTNPGDTVLDPCFGSNTTGVACARLGRNYVGIEKDAEYFRLGSERLAKERERLGLK